MWKWNRRHRSNWHIWLSIGLLWLLRDCSAPTSVTPVVTPTCYPRPEPTGEKIIRPTIETAPTAQVAPGQTVTVVFSGSYLVANNALVCGGDQVVGHVYSDQLPGFRWERTVEVRLDERVLNTVECGQTCKIEVTLPTDVAPGAHRLILIANGTRLSFELQVTDSSGA